MDNDKLKQKPSKLPEKGIKIKINLVKIGIAVLILLTIAPFVLAFFQNQVQSSEISLSQALDDLRNDKVSKVTVENDTLTFNYKNGSVKTSTKEDTISFTEILDRAHIDPTKVSYVIEF